MSRNKKNIIIFTDGACTDNGKATAKAGIGIHFPNKEFSDVTKKFISKPITNQRAELYAIQCAINIVLADNTRSDKITIYSDSLYSIKSLSEWIIKWEKNNWKNANGQPVKNLDLIQPIYRTLKMNKDRINFIHVKAHTGNQTFEALGNKIADQLASNSIQENLSKTF